MHTTSNDRRRAKSAAWDKRPRGPMEGGSGRIALRRCPAAPDASRPRSAAWRDCAPGAPAAEAEPLPARAGHPRDVPSWTIVLAMGVAFRRHTDAACWENVRISNPRSRPVDRADRLRGTREGAARASNGHVSDAPTPRLARFRGIDGSRAGAAKRGHRCPRASSSPPLPAQATAREIDFTARAEAPSSIRRAAASVRRPAAAGSTSVPRVLARSCLPRPAALTVGAGCGGDGAAHRARAGWNPQAHEGSIDDLVIGGRVRPARGPGYLPVARDHA